jgi:hypothetical protein
VSADLWNAFVKELQAKRETDSFVLNSEIKRIAEFVRLLPGAKRIPLLLKAYDSYRELSTCNFHHQAGHFHRSCDSILISTILTSKIRPNEAEALEILRRSYHQCGHGSDVEPALAFAETVFQNRPYSQPLFDAIAVYRETLRATRSSAAFNVKRKLTWLLWHDPRYIEKECCTGRIQRSIHAMEPQRAFAWQWLFRNIAPGLNSTPGKAWLKEGRKRLSPIGDEEFLRRLDQWFTFPDKHTILSPAGSAMLRLLIWYGSLVDVERSLPILVRIVHVHWQKPEPAQKVIFALAWLLREHQSLQFHAEIKMICQDWVSDSAAVKRLQEVCFPHETAARQQRERKEVQQAKKNLDARTGDALAEAFPAR